jgi:Ca2+/Na+ antiporter
VEIALLLGSLALILLGAELFTNGIEWFGHRLNLAEGAVGSVLAAVATALPETLIPIIAIIVPILLGGGAPSSAEVGVGAILGAPFMLATLAMFVTGVGVLIFSRGGRRSTRLDVNTEVLARDVLFFTVAYAVAIGSTLLPAPVHPLKWVVAAGLLVAYAGYVRAHFTDEVEGESDPSELARLHLTRLPGMGRAPALRFSLLPESAVAETAGQPRLRIIVIQVLAALAAIILGAQVFVGAVEDPGPGDRPDRHGAAREVQQPHLGALPEGHAGHGEHHRGHGLPELHPDLRWHRLYRMGVPPGERPLAGLRRRGVPGRGSHLRDDVPAAAPVGMDPPRGRTDLRRLRRGGAAPTHGCGTRALMGAGGPGLRHDPVGPCPTAILGAPHAGAALTRGPGR